MLFIDGARTLSVSVSPEDNSKGLKGNLDLSGQTSMKDLSASQQIDAMIRDNRDWKGKTLSQLRALIRKADPAVVDEVKWKKPTDPSGVPV